jgi:hypothetical protein
MLFFLNTKPRRDPDAVGKIHLRQRKHNSQKTVQKVTWSRILWLCPCSCSRLLHSNISNSRNVRISGEASKIRRYQQQIVETPGIDGTSTLHSSRELPTAGTKGTQAESRQKQQRNRNIIGISIRRGAGNNRGCFQHQGRRHQH